MEDTWLTSTNLHILHPLTGQVSGSDIDLANMEMKLKRHDYMVRKCQQVGIPYLSNTGMYIGLLRMYRIFIYVAFADLRHCPRKAFPVIQIQ